MKKIPLTQGKFAIIDDEDYDFLSQFKWCAHKGKNTFYSVRHITGQSQNKIKNIKYKPKKILMHRLIMKVLSSNDQIDHINGNGLDNRKTNLRICNNQQNTFNSKSRKGSSIYKGVSYRTDCKKYRARISFNGQARHLGYFNNEIEAAKAYDEKAKELFGEFASLNIKENQQ